jgi:hypothetical protein
LREQFREALFRGGAGQISDGESNHRIFSEAKETG